MVHSLIDPNSDADSESSEGDEVGLNTIKYYQDKLRKEGEQKVTKNLN